MSMDAPVSIPINQSVLPSQSNHLTNPFASPPQPPKRPVSQTLLLVITTLVVGVSVPTTVFLVKQSNDIRGRAAEPKNTQPVLLPSVAPTPKLSVCGGTCTTHADCSPGFFCMGGFCKNALSPTAIDCVCQGK